LPDQLERCAFILTFARLTETDILCLVMDYRSWRTGMSSEAEIRMNGMQALIGALGLVDAGRPMAATFNQA
jgi:hypothetical protein